jgi:glyoxylase-like metal-dependent hydrolase (beta-lactamase superfamily II)
LSDGVYACIHKFGGKATCNVGIVDNGKETLIFDSFLSPEVAEELLDALDGLGLSPVKYVVNSHYHNDHIRGNQVFPQDVRIISTLRTKELIEYEEPLQIAYEKEKAPARFAYYDSLYTTFKGDKGSREFQKILMWRPYYETLSNSYQTVKTRVPDMFIDTILYLDGPDRRIQLISKGPGHTESDLICYLPDDGVLFAGDLVSQERHPYVADGNISAWKSWLDYLAGLDTRSVMPGHGEVGNRELILEMKNYLTDLETAVSQLLKDNATAGSLDSLPVPERYKDWWFDRFYPLNLRFAYNSVMAQE